MSKQITTRQGVLGLNQIDIENTDNQAPLWDSGDDIEGQADCLVYFAPHDYLYNPQLDWLRNIGTHWEGDLAISDLLLDIIEILKARRKVCKELWENDAITAKRLMGKCATTDKNINGTIRVLKSKLSVPYGDFNNEPYKLNTLNGVINLKNGELEQRPKHHRFTYCIPTEYDPSADFTTWHEWLSKHVEGGKQTADFMQRGAGYSITADMSEEVFFYLYGVNGRNGKGTFLETVRRVLGRKMSAGIEAHAASSKRRAGDKGHDIARIIHGTRFLNISETTQGDSLSNGFIKNIVGGGTISAAQMYKSMVEASPQFKIWIDSNWKLNALGEDEAFWARPLVVKWPISYVGKADPKFKRGMLSDGNLKAVLNWMVKGAVAWGEEGLKPPLCVSEAVKEHQLYNDSIGGFLKDGGYKLGSGLVDFYEYPTTQLKDEYMIYCEQVGVTPVGGRRLANYLSDRGVLVGGQSPPIKRNGVTVRVYRGIYKESDHKEKEF